MTTMTNNGRTTRKTLASQLDRLDTILDCLADGLNEAVATADSPLGKIERGLRQGMPAGLIGCAAYCSLFKHQPR